MKGLQQPANNRGRPPGYVWVSHRIFAGRSRVGEKYRRETVNQINK